MMTSEPTRVALPVNPDTKNQITTVLNENKASKIKRNKRNIRTELNIQTPFLNT